MSNLFRKKEKFYLPGEEIKVNKSVYSKGCIEENDPMSKCRFRMLLAITAMVALFLTISVRTFILCISGYEPKSETEEAKPLPQVEIKSNTKRADVTDRNNTIIATSIPTFSLYAHPNQVKNKEEVAIRLSKYFDDLSYDNILANLSKKTNFVYLKRNISLAQKYEIYAFGINGLGFEETEKRIYPHGNLFAHILGKADIDNKKGLAGIERGLNERLTTSEIPLQLSVDTGIQDTIREKLYAGVSKFKADRAAAILMNVNTGEIISMVSLPDFDPNNDAPNFSFATQGAYEPGSVLKIFNAAIGLESGKVNLKEKFDATKPLVINKYNKINDYKGENRWLDLQEILVHSSNIGSAHIALRVGKDIQQAHLRNFGFFDKIKDFEVAEKETPTYPKNWKKETVATVGFGHGISVTPLHLISAFSAVVNGGTYYKPTLLKQQEQPQGRKILTTDTSVKMRKLLREVVVKGSGKKANVIGYEVAGKTGTAMKVVNGKYKDKVVITSFLATFPASSPKYALLVMMDEPKPSEETFWYATSGWNAVPTAGEIIATIAPQLNLRANYDIDDKRMKMIEASYNL